MDGSEPPETTKRPKSGAERTAEYRAMLKLGVRVEVVFTWEQVDALTCAGQIPPGVEDNLPALRIELSRIGADCVRRIVGDGPDPDDCNL